MDKKICSGIVTFNPNIELLFKVVDAVASQVIHIIIFDNNSDNIGEIDEVCKKFSCKLLRSKENKGIAYALNRMCEYAYVNGYEWILTLDHDSIISENLISSFIPITKIDKVGIICPRVKYVDVDIKEKYNTENKYIEVPACMTSGSLMNLNAWNKTTHFDEWLFIDSVDNDICYKLKVLGFKVLRDNNTFMVHNLGRPIQKFFLIFSYPDYQYSPFRLYYIVRNRIYLTKKYWKYEGFKFILASTYIILTNILIYAFDNNRRKMVLKGLIDGIFKS